jgi:hypothetical protein
LLFGSIAAFRLIDLDPLKPKKKSSMSEQYNKLEKRRHRLSYLKRKQRLQNQRLVNE